MSDPTEEITIACPHCGQYLAIAPSMLGSKLECPVCGKSFMPAKTGVASDSPACESRGSIDADPEGTLSSTPAPERQKGSKPSSFFEKVKPVLAATRTAISVAWAYGKRQFLRLPERMQGAVLASVVFLVGLAVFSGKGERSDRSETTSFSGLSSSDIDPPRSRSEIKRTESQQEPHGRRNESQPVTETRTNRDEPKGKKEANDKRLVVREPTEAEQIFKEGLDFLLGENGRERNLANAYRRFEEADKEGCILGEVGVAHICWTATEEEKRELKTSGIAPSTLYAINWKHAAMIGESRIAKCEFGLFQLQRESARAEGLKMLKEAASEGSDTAIMFLSQAAKQKAASGLSYETIVGILAENEETMSLFQRACCVELGKEYLLSLSRPPAQRTPSESRQESEKGNSGSHQFELDEEQERRVPMYELVARGEEPAPRLAGHETNPRTGLVFRPDGGPLDLRAEVWNAMMVYGKSGKKPHDPPTWYEEIMIGDRKVPMLVGHQFKGETGLLYRSDGGEMDPRAELWNAMMTFNSSGKKPHDPPTLYEQVMLGERNLPVIYGHHFDGKTGKLFRTDGGELSPYAKRWNDEIEASNKSAGL